MVAGSIYIVHRVLVIVAIASHRFVDDCLKELQARILLRPLASTPHGPPDPFVLNAACLRISPFISEYTDSGISSSIGPREVSPMLFLNDNDNDNDNYDDNDNDNDNMIMIMIMIMIPLDFL